MSWLREESQLNLEHFSFPRGKVVRCIHTIVFVPAALVCHSESHFSLLSLSVVLSSECVTSLENRLKPFRLL